MKEILLVGSGGFLGAVARHLLAGWVHRLMDTSWFPYGTFAVNTLGCFLIGYLSGFAEQRDLFTPDMQLFIFIGILGGFTTFSSFGYETFALARSGYTLAMMTNILLHMILCLGSVWLGYRLSHPA